MTLLASHSDAPTCWHSVSVNSALRDLQSDRHSGLTQQQAISRLEQYGLNEIQEARTRTAWEIFLDQFTNIMLVLLIAVAIVSGLLDFTDLQAGKLSPGAIPFKDTIAILAIVILNGLLGYFQENKAEKDLAALKRMASSKVRVIRDGKALETDSKNLVPGDLMLLEAGAQIAADARVIEAANLQVREAALTGEAHAVTKNANRELPADTALGDRVNLVFQGTDVVQGRATAVVTSTGMQTELGRIATLLQSVESDATPLQQRMDHLSKVLVIGSMSLVALVVLGGILYLGWEAWKELLEVSLSMAVAIVPEGLPAVITVTLALGTQRMVKRNALIRKLPAVETLGSVTTICSDKTGTLTQNKMVVKRVDTSSLTLRVSGDGYDPVGKFYPITESLESTIPTPPEDQDELLNLLTACTVCNDAMLQQEQREWRILGDPTEGALLSLAGKAGFEKDQWLSKLPRVAEIPFSSERKRMSVIVQAIAPELAATSQLLPYMMFTKGSPELILERCRQIQHQLNARSLSPAHRDRILDQNNQMAGRGLRVLGFACKPLATIPAVECNDSDNDRLEDHPTEQDLIWLGLVGMLDAPRPEVREAVARCRSAGIRPIMITGDHQLTAQAVAEDLGMARLGDRVLTGRDLEQMDQSQLETAVEQVRVYARVAPEHKLRIVQALQSNHQVVAMTGDGVNDAPALKQADIGIAMGVTGTDVSKDASDMVLLDDNFATIIAATEEGRVVYTNIRRFIKYILGSNIGELMTIGAAPLIGMGGVPLTPLQILWMNLVTDGFPALALAVEPADPNVMKRPPHDPQESIFARGLGGYIVRIGCILAILTISLMVWSHGYTTAHPTLEDPEGKRWKTIVFTTLCIAQMGHAIAIRSSTRLTLELNPLSNPYLWTSVVLTTLLQLLLIYVPVLRQFFGTHYLSLGELGVCLGVSSLMFVWIELEKLLARWYRRWKQQ